MPSLALWMKFLHILIAFLFVAGLIGRNIMIRQAAKSTDIGTVTMLLGLSGRFEKHLVIPFSIAILPAGLLTMWTGHVPFVESGAYWLITSVIVYAGLIVLVPTIFLPRGKVFGAALAAAEQQGAVTPELEEAFRDPAVAFARTTEVLGVAFIIAMMVLKPF